MAPQEREDEIVRGAIGFFAEHGFEGQTRELAKRLKVTQPLLYRYFPNKEALVERVYQEVFVGRWDPFWEEMISDRSRKLSDRLIEFYQSYSRAILTYEWVRLFMFSGLKNLDYNARYLRLLRERLFSRIVEELRFEYHRPRLDQVPLTDCEVEAIWALHAAIFYLGVRKWIYNLPPPKDLQVLVTERVATFLEGVSVALVPARRPRGGNG